MKHTIEHLPKEIRRELESITQHIRGNVTDCSMIILFGSYARGNYILLEYPEFYRSDYDILVVTKSPRTNPIGPIEHTKVLFADIDSLNKQLETSQYFYTELINEGIVLYDSGTVQLSKTNELSFEEIHKLASNHYEQGYNTACELIKNGENDAAACRELYKTIYLVFTLLDPREEDTEKLYHKVKGYSKELHFIDFGKPRDLIELTECICQDRLAYYKNKKTATAMQ